MNAPALAVGKRSGSGRSVNVATPIGTSESPARNSSATAFARSSREGALSEAEASIEREMSSATKAWASRRVSRGRSVRTTGCAAAKRDQAAHRAQGDRDDEARPEPRGRKPEQLAGPSRAAVGEGEHDERDDRRERDERRRRGQELELAQDGHQ